MKTSGMRTGFLMLGLLAGAAGCTSIRGVRPVYPEPGQEVADLQPVLEWQASEEPGVTYDLSLSEKGAKKKYKKAPYYREGLTGTSHRVETPLKPGMEYTWALRTRRGDEVAEWNKIETRVFLVLYYQRTKRALTFRTP